MEKEIGKWKKKYKEIILKNIIYGYIVCERMSFYIYKICRAAKKI